MIRHDVPVLQCDICSHRWLQEGEKLPERCPSRKCRSVKWDSWGAAPISTKHSGAKGGNKFLTRDELHKALGKIIKKAGEAAETVAKPQSVVKERLLTRAQLVRKHDPKACRIYGCLLCKEAKGKA